MVDVLTPEQRRRTMQAIRASGTGIEIRLSKALSKLGIRHRHNVKYILGKPDIAFTKEKVAVFCDSEFWHGKDWLRKKQRLEPTRLFGIKR